MNEIPPVKRPRGRPRKHPLVPVNAGYPGPSLDAILRLSDVQVAVGFDELGVEPSPFHWTEDDQANVSLWHDFGMRMTDAEYSRTNPKTTAEIEGLRQSSFAIHQDNLRTELLGAHLAKWIDSLDDAQLVAEAERLSDTKFSESQKRYAKRSDLQQQVSELTWPVLIAASSLYVPPINPLDGGKSK